jgi:hypothetical protein
MAALRRKKFFTAFLRTIIALVVGVIVVVTITVLSFGSTASSSAKSSNQKRYKATRPLVVDKQTGQPRLPSQEEIEQTVSNLRALANRPESLPQVATSSGAVVVDLEGGFNGVFLGRPNADGTWETRCVFTLEEGMEFLGLVADTE